MLLITNGRLLFNEVPVVYPEPGKTTVYDASQKIDLETVPLHGGVLVKTLVLSSDPWLRLKMRAPDNQYPAAFVLGEPLVNFGIGVVLRSEDPSFKPGDHIYGIIPFQHYFVQDKNSLSTIRIQNREKNLPWSVYLGVCGEPGKTAYMGWKEYAHPKKGEIVFVTSAMGPVGATVLQFAKADGLKVIASAGSDEKVARLLELGADVAFNYKTVNMNKILQQEGPIDIFWDNVGGETFEAAINAANGGARFIECGALSQYSGGAPYHVKNLVLVVGKELKISGFVAGGALYAKYNDEFDAEIPKKVAKGEIKYIEDGTDGLESAGQAVADVLTGRNVGKKFIRVADE